MKSGLRPEKMGVAQNQEDSLVERPKAFRTSAGIAGDSFGQSVSGDREILAQFEVARASCAWFHGRDAPRHFFKLHSYQRRQCALLTPFNDYDLPLVA
jgi:hypothetical protein